MRRPLTIILAIILAPFALCIAFFYFAVVSDDLYVRPSLRVYSGANFIFEDRARWGANKAIKSLYYWTPSAISDVQQYYEGFLQPFLETRDPYGKWLISAYKIDAPDPKPDTSSAFLAFESFCSVTKDNGCVSVSLVDTEQVDEYHLAVSTVSTSYRITAPPELADLPSPGTLIIYTYTVGDW